MAAMRIKLCSDIHGAADLLARRAAGPASSPPDLGREDGRRRHATLGHLG